MFCLQGRQLQIAAPCHVSQEIGASEGAGQREMPLLRLLQVIDKLQDKNVSSSANALASLAPSLLPRPVAKRSFSPIPTHSLPSSLPPALCVIPSSFLKQLCPILFLCMTTFLLSASAFPSFFPSHLPSSPKGQHLVALGSDGSPSLERPRAARADGVTSPTRSLGPSDLLGPYILGADGGCMLPVERVHDRRAEGEALSGG
eukprot:768749-Hanusia_phi.AAC.36